MKRCLLILLVHGGLATTVNAITVQIYPDAPAVCTYPVGSLGASASGGTPPYSYSWSTGASGPYIEGLVAGTYSVTVTDDLGEQAYAEYSLSASPLMAGAIGLVGCPDGSLGPPFRMIGHGGIYYVGVPPLTIDGPYMADVITGNESWQQALYVNPTQGWDPPGTYVNVPFTDANGCPGMLEFTIPSPPAYPDVQLLSVDPACSNHGVASFQVAVTPNQHAYYIEWFHELWGSQGMITEASTGWNQLFGQLAQTTTLASLFAGDHGLRIYPRYPDPFQWVEEYFFVGSEFSCADSILFTVPAMPEPCATLKGTVHMDDNQNCVFNGFEARVPQSVIMAEPGGYTALSNASGYYQMNLPTGSYQVTQTAPGLVEHCVGGPIAVDLPTNGMALTRNMADTALVPRDVEIAMNSGFARPGFDYPVWIGVEHNTPGGTGTVTISCTFDPVLSYMSANPTPGNVSGNTITWTLPQINSFGYRNVSIQFQVPPDPLLLGTDLEFTASVSIAQPEPDLSNNTVAHTRTITGAYDPNDKLALTSIGNTSVWQIGEDEWIDYTIRFQNTGTDTAFTVIITDTLPPTLDPATFDMHLHSHACSVALIGQGILRFTFPNIQLPDSNVNELLSHGLVQFRIRPRLPILPGTEISNIANIYFDFNPPVITEPSVLVATTGTGFVERVPVPHLRVYPNPVTDVLYVERTDDLPLSGEWSIMSVDGRSVMTGIMNGNRSTILLPSIAPGPYILRLQSPEGIISRPFIKKTMQP